MSCNLYGSQTIAPYSNVERTRAMYDNLLHSSGQYFRFRRRNPSVEFAFFTMLVIYYKVLTGILTKTNSVKHSKVLQVAVRPKSTMFTIQ